MPTYEVLPRSTADLDRLTQEQRRLFRRTVAAFVEDPRTGDFRQARGFAEFGNGQPGNPSTNWAVPGVERVGSARLAVRALGRVPVLGDTNSAAVSLTHGLLGRR
ncbi:hypothetical protein GCM10010145_61410 [Streptomyces ruber]|uniref:Uncharacterized protein n=2 Tax=Streptomyces TaxID=1883 RepID=A0A918BPE4_9ACTN|nr:hypothetical protein GCM10010145_61410 [Streptomyces ruber]